MRLPLSGAALAALLAACAGGGNTTSSKGAPPAPSAAESAAAKRVDRGPTRIDIDGDPNGLWWDAKDATLYIADSAHNRILKWTDGTPVTLAAELPAAPPSGADLGQLVRTKEGTLVVTRFGFGTDGGVVYTGPGAKQGVIPGLDPARRRIGLTIADDGALYDAYFVATGKAKIGAVARLDLSGKEVDILPGLNKPIGVLASGGDLIVSDQGAGTIIDAPIASPDHSSVIAQLDAPDLLCAGPNGSYFTGGKGGAVRQVFRDGKSSAFAGGFHEVRGVAYDAEHKRLFASDHAGKADAGAGMSALRILPVDG